MKERGIGIEWVIFIWPYHDLVLLVNWIRDTSEGSDRDFLILMRLIKTVFGTVQGRGAICFGLITV